MAYSILADVLLRISNETLAQVSQDQTGAQGVNESRVSSAIVDADSLIDFYLGSRYTVPFNPVPVIIKILSVNIAIFNVYKAKFDNEIPKEIRNLYTESLAMLDKIKAGEFEIKDGEQINGGDFTVLTNIDEDDIVYTQELIDLI